MDARSSFDVAIVGGGIVGLATARALLAQRPGARIVILEKESEVARHQTGHNSGVIHMGIYYRPGSLKARLSIEGASVMKQFCAERGIPVSTCGKVIVATAEAELPALAELERRGIANGVPGLRRIDERELRAIEPHAAGIAALHSPQTAIVDYTQVARTLADELRAEGAELRLRTQLLSGHAAPDGVTVLTSGGPVAAELLINCAGLHADTIARMMGVESDVRIVPFRGEYYTLRPDREYLVRGLIYPTPDPRFPFLGVHFTRMVHGGVEAGPNAVPALAREGYSWRHINRRELAETVRFRGFQRLARTYWRTGAYEFYRSLSKGAFVRSLQRLVPAVRGEDLVRGGAGVRAQAIRSDGTLVDDFAIARTERAIHVINAPSPAATASLAIGEHIAGLALGRADAQFDAAV